MRTQLLTLLFTFLATGLCAQLDLGLRGHWTFAAGSIVDLSGNANNGTSIGGVTTTVDRNGNAECALLFPGNTSHVSIPYAAELDPAPADAFTVSLWYQGGSMEMGDQEWLFARRNVGSSWATTAYAISLYDLNRVLGTTGNSTALWSPIMPPIPDTQWHHVALIYNNGNLQLWLDNELEVADSTQQGLVTQSTQGITIGEQFEGAMDDIRYYDRALDPQEVALLYNEATACATTTGLAQLTIASISAMPNPTADVLTVQLPQPTGELELFDATGRSVLRMAVNSSTATLHLGHLNNGLYLLRYGNGADQVVQRIAKR